MTFQAGSLIDMAVCFLRLHHRVCFQDQTKCTFGGRKAELHVWGTEIFFFVLSERHKGWDSEWTVICFSSLHVTEHSCHSVRLLLNRNSSPLSDGSVQTQVSAVPVWIKNTTNWVYAEGKCCAVSFDHFLFPFSSLFLVPSLLLLLFFIHAFSPFVSCQSCPLSRSDSFSPSPSLSPAVGWNG